MVAIGGRNLMSLLESAGELHRVDDNAGVGIHKFKPRDAWFSTLSMDLQAA